jgi:hypothetical protein
LLAQERVLHAEHHPIAQPSRDLLLEIRRVIPGRPPVRLVPDVSLVHQHGDRLRLPWPSRPRGDDRQLRETCRDVVEVTRVTVVEDYPSSALQTRAQPGGADEDQYWDPGFDARLVERRP